MTIFQLLIMGREVVGLFWRYHKGQAFSYIFLWIPVNPDGYWEEIHKKDVAFPDRFYRDLNA